MMSTMFHREGDGLSHKEIPRYYVVTHHNREKRMMMYIASRRLLRRANCCGSDNGFSKRPPRNDNWCGMN